MGSYLGVAIRSRKAASVLSSIDANGWSAQHPSPSTFAPDVSPVFVPVTHKGFDASGTIVEVADNLIITQRVRQVAPNDGLLTPNTVALSDYVYSSSTIAGTVNNSLEDSPQPVFNWTMVHRLVVGDTIAVELTAWHRDGRNNREVVCVIFTATDGTTTVSQTVAATVVSGRTGDQNAVIVYKANLNIAGLIDNADITVNARVYPWLGVAASIADSSTGTDIGRFAPRYFYRSTARFANPPRCYISATGVDTTGKWQQPGLSAQTDAAAKASPFLTMSGAFNASNNATRGIFASGGLPLGYLDGAIVYLPAGNLAAAGPTVTMNSRLASPIITRDPTATKAQVVIPMGSFSPKWNVNSPLFAIGATSVVFDDVTLQYVSSTSNFRGADVTLNNVAFDFQNLATVIGLVGGRGSIFGCTVANWASGTFFVSTGASQWDRMRGFNWPNMQKSSLSYSLLIGSVFGNPTAFAPATPAGAIVAFNRVMGISTGSGTNPFGNASAITGWVCSQNVIETLGNTAGGSSATLRINADNNTFSLTHTIMRHNTLLGYHVYGRTNGFYIETGGGAAVIKLSGVSGNIHVQNNIKTDVFGFASSYADYAALIGNWSVLYGVGSRGEIYQGIENPIGTARHAFPGLSSIRALDDPVTFGKPRLDAGFVFNGAYAPHSPPDGAGTDGVGGSNAHLVSTSIARGLVSRPTLSHDLDGVARGSASTAAGAYVYAVGE